MIPSFINKRLKEYYQYFRFRWSRKAGIFLFFVFLSSIFWLLKSLDKNYNILIQYPINYQDNPSGKVLVGDVPNSVYINVSARGYMLLKMKFLAASNPIAVSLKKSNLQQKTGADSSHYYLITKQVTENFISKLDVDVQVHDILPDSLFLNFANKIIKKVAIHPNVNVKELKQYILKKTPYTVPDSILISGPDYLVQNINHINTTSYEASKNVTLETTTLQLEQPANISLSNSEVIVSIEREKFTEKTLQVPVRVINLPDSIEIKTFPSEIQLTCHVGLSQYQKVKASDFLIAVDYNDIQKSASKKLMLQIISIPSSVQSIDFKPHTVEYILEKWR